LGNKVNADIVIVDGSHANIKIQVAGIVKVNIDCEGEAWELQGSKVVLPNLSDPADCLGK